MSVPLRLGILRLVDSAPAVVADEWGLFRDAGLDVALHIEPSWANVADKLAWGALDAAILLAPLALAAPIGLRGRATRLRVPMGISRGGNSIVVGAAVPKDGGGDALAGLARWLGAQPRRPRFAVVHGFSMHNLLLRHFLAGSGLDPDLAVETVVVPPDRIVGELGAGRIAGFCAGAPWGDQAQASGVGRVVCGTSAIRPGHVEKCLAVAEAWAARHPDALAALEAALREALSACERPQSSIAALVAERLDLPEGPTRASLPGGTATERVRFEGAALFPAAEAAWIASEMRRWGWLSADNSVAALAATALTA